MSIQANLPMSQALQGDIDRAIEILKAEGCQEIFLFGSIAAGRARPESDVDVAVRGCPSGHYFRVLGKLMLALNRPVDLVDLDSHQRIAQRLQERGELVRIG